MNSLLRSKTAIKAHIIVVSRYGKPLNRWQWHYANEDGVFEEDFNWIERKKMPQPFPADDFIYSHKGLPKANFPPHAHDFRYNYYPERLPRRHHVPDFLFKLYNFSDWDEIMHGLQWVDFELDYQLADPMESNHYIISRGPGFCLFLIVMAFVFCVIYPLWGYGVIDGYEDPFKLRKLFQFPDASLVFTWLNSFPGQEGLDIPPDPRLGARMDKDGNILPNNIKKYYFEDEYTYRL